MSPDLDRSDALARFHRALVEEIARTRPAYLREPFTVAEIYQNLVPYRTHRDRIGVEMNGDYEDALLRLLSGEGDYLLLESEHARSEIADELSSPNPNTGLYREFAAVDVRLNPVRMPHDVAEMARGGDTFTPPDIDFGAHGHPVPPRASAPPAPRPATGSGPGGIFPPPATPPGTPPAPPTAAAAAPAPAPTRTPPAKRRETPTGCPWCRETLPRRDNLNYCPFCGADLQTAPCANCGAELEAGWRFCPTCGTPAGNPD